MAANPFIPPHGDGPILPRKPREIAEFLRISRSGLYEKMNPKSAAYDPTFPTTFKTGIKSVAFDQHAVERWVRAQAKTSPR